MEALNLGLAVVGGLTLVLGLFAGLLQSRAYVLSDPMIAALAGVAVGPHGLAVLRLSWVGDPLAVPEQVARLTVAIAVMSIALRIPDEYFRERARTLSALLAAGMAGGQRLVLLPRAVRPGRAGRGRRTRRPVNGP